MNLTENPEMTKIVEQLAPQILNCVTVLRDIVLLCKY